MYSPRIYTYKITFEEVPYYYYGMHEEKVYDEEYWGSPKTHKWCWELYTPKKQILETFGNRKDAYEVEKRLIKPVYNTDKLCLNEGCGGIYSLKICSNAGKIGGTISGKMHKKNKTGIFSLTEEQRKESCRIGGNKNVESGHIKRLGKKTAENHIKNKTGIYAFTQEQKSKTAKKAGNKCKELGVGIFAITPEQRNEISKKAANKCKELGVGIFAITPEQKSEIGKKGGETNKQNKTGVCGLSKEQLSQICKKVNAQRWMCTETGFIANPGNLSHYQKSKGIDKSKRIRLE